MAPLKVTDDQIVKAIQAYIDTHGWSPSVREIAKMVGLKASSSMHRRLLKLKEQGRIVYKGVRQIRVIS